MIEVEYVCIGSEKNTKVVSQVYQNFSRPVVGGFVEIANYGFKSCNTAMFKIERIIDVVRIVDGIDSMEKSEIQKIKIIVSAYD